MNRWIAIMSATALCACGGARTSPATDGATSKEGVYTFSAIIPLYEPGTSVTAQGTVSFFDDSLLVQTGPECTPYQPSERYKTPSTERVRIIHCGGASLQFDRQKPESAKWYTWVQVPKQRNVCVDYAPRPTGGGNTPRCLQYRPETYYVRQQRTGKVQIKRVN